MKKRIYKINNKNLVTGNPNEVTENEILVKENNDGTVELSHRNNGTLETLGSGGSGGSNIRYFDVSNITLDESSMAIVICGLIGKTIQDNIFKITPNVITALLDPSWKLISVAIDMDMKIIEPSISNELMTVEQMLKINNQYDMLLACPELTEEQFYDLTLPTE